MGDSAGLGTTYNNIGSIYRKQGEWDKALEFFHKSENIRIEVGDRPGLVSAYSNIGVVYRKKNEISKGNDYLILAGFIAMMQGMKHELAQMDWAFGPIIEKMGKEKFAEIGKKLAQKKGLITLKKD